MISALFVEKNGPYFNRPGVDPWDITRDAKQYYGTNRVIAHPPCERWGRYWSGGPSARVRRKLGDDQGCFIWALHAVQRCTGVLEHPEGSHAFRHFGLPIPKRSGGWTDPDRYGGRSCCVAQFWYGHKARKLTWLYGVGIEFKELNCNPVPVGAGIRLDQGFHSKEHRARAIKTGACQRMSKRQRMLSPELFVELLISMVQDVIL